MINQEARQKEKVTSVVMGFITFFKWKKKSVGFGPQLQTAWPSSAEGGDSVI